MVTELDKKNYMTPGSFKRMQQELQQLFSVDRPKLVETIAWAAGNGDRSENGDYIYGKKKLREIDKRLEFLNKRLNAAEVIDPASIKSEVVVFGATVTFRDEDDKVRTYSIVGVDEVDAAKGRISWVSPLGAALLKAKVGDFVTYHSPRGEQQIELLEIKYVEIP